jgi:hypothetical protein
MKNWVDKKKKLAGVGAWDNHDSSNRCRIAS